MVPSADDGAAIAAWIGHPTVIARRAASPACRKSIGIDLQDRATSRLMPKFDDAVDLAVGRSYGR
jgi:hypothetical protein